MLSCDEHLNRAVDLRRFTSVLHFASFVDKDCPYQSNCNRCCCDTTTKTSFVMSEESIFTPISLKVDAVAFVIAFVLFLARTANLSTTYAVKHQRCAVCCVYGLAYCTVMHRKSLDAKVINQPKIIKSDGRRSRIAASASHSPDEKWIVGRLCTSAYACCRRAKESER